MIKRIVGWFVLVPLCAVLIVFALANRHAISVHFDPVSPADAPIIAHAEVPLFIVIYGMLFLGVILGGVAAWFAQGKNRRERRRFKRDATRLTKELAEMRRATRQKSDEHALLSPDDLLEDE